MSIRSKLSYCKKTVIKLEKENDLDHKTVTRSAKDMLDEGDFEDLIIGREKINGELKAETTGT